jgi:predicted outer membrane repeat protein
MPMRPLNACRTLFVLLLASAGARAACPVDVTHYRVGANTTWCSHASIQSAIDEAGACPAVVEITREHLLYTGAFCDPNNANGCHLSISGKNITLQGRADGETCYALTQCFPGPTCPAPSSTAPLVTLDGGNDGRVLTISGASSVNVRNLTITHGAADYNGKGGGIYYSGVGNLNIARSTISFNYAGFGGGILLEASGGTANLRLLDNALVLSNIAQFSGGGIIVSRTSVLYAQKTPALIGLNEALGEDPLNHTQVGGYGGGVVINGPARADIGSGGYGGLGVIYGNKAVYGGGLAVFGGEDGFFTQAGRANLYTTDAAQPVTIQGNFASVRGGALYSKGYSSYVPNVYNQGQTCISNGRIVDNAAPDGAIAYLDWGSDIVNQYSGSNLYINTAICGGTASVACPPGSTCNQAYDNVSRDDNANPKPGSAIVVGKSSSFRADKLDLRGSTGAHLVYITGDDYAYQDDGLLRSCLLADNSVTDTLIHDGANTLDVENCTIAGNVIGAGFVLDANTLFNSLVFQPGKLIGTISNGSSYVLANTGAFTPNGTLKTTDDPRFVDPAHSNYHLLLASLAVDYAGGQGGGTDLDGYPRDKDLAAHPDTFGPRDLGAYERQSAFGCDLALDVVFCDGFQAE